MSLKGSKQESQYWSSNFHVFKNHRRACELCKFKGLSQDIWGSKNGVKSRFLHNSNVRFTVSDENEEAIHPGHW